MSKNTVLGPEVGYTDLLDAETIEKLAAKELDPDKYFPLRPSAAGYCGRRLAYGLMEHLKLATYPKEAVDPNMDRLLKLGHSVEYSALKNLETIPGITLRYKQQVVTLFQLDGVKAGVPGPLIEGSIDTVLWSDEFKCVLDVKSQKDGFSVAYKTRWDETLDKFAKMSSLQRIGESAYYADSLEDLLTELNGDFLSDNLYQLNLYALSPFCKERGIDHAVIYKYNKNDSRHYELRFRPSQAIYDATRKKFNLIYQAVAGKQNPELVDRDHFLGSMKCAFCPYQLECWKTNALKEFWKTMPKEWPVDEHKLKVKGLSKKFEQLEKLDKTAKEKALLEEEILKILEEKKVKKIKLANGDVFEVRFLKSPSPHFELRKGKI